jgi:hypothetical protein
MRIGKRPSFLALTIISKHSSRLFFSELSRGQMCMIPNVTKQKPHIYKNEANLYSCIFRAIMTNYTESIDHVKKIKCYGAWLDHFPSERLSTARLMWHLHWLDMTSRNNTHCDSSFCHQSVQFSMSDTLVALCHCCSFPYMKRKFGPLTLS